MVGDNGEALQSADLWVPGYFSAEGAGSVLFHQPVYRPPGWCTADRPPRTTAMRTTMQTLEIANKLREECQDHGKAAYLNRCVTVKITHPGVTLAVGLCNADVTLL
mmetsp:Transcript_12646/g.37889  ORF Transcript_12646/g.37889 Transcript_12646/m.37889 type:complete len:106 (-) Transcript_12646:352-669(-)